MNDEKRNIMRHLQILLDTSVQHCTESFNHDYEAVKEVEGLERRSKTLFFFEDDMIMYIEIQRIHNKSVELINKVIAYSIQVQKLTVFFYTSNEQYEKANEEDSSVYKMHYKE